MACPSPLPLLHTGLVQPPSHAVRALPSAPHRLLIVSMCHVRVLDRGRALRAGLRRPRSTSSTGLARQGAQGAVLSGGDIHSSMELGVF